MSNVTVSSLRDLCDVLREIDLGDDHDHVEINGKRCSLTSLPVFGGPEVNDPGVYSWDATSLLVDGSNHGDSSQGWQIVPRPGFTDEATEFADSLARESAGLAVQGARDDNRPAPDLDAVEFNRSHGDWQVLAEEYGEYAMLNHLESEWRHAYLSELVAILLDQAIERSGLSARQFAERVMSRDERTIRNWRARRSPIPPQAAAWLRAYVAGEVEVSGDLLDKP